jgi:hypothetical protein
MVEGPALTADGTGVVGMVGVAALRMLADRTGLTAGLSRVLAKPGFNPIHDRGRVLTDVACSVAAGGVDLYDIEALRAHAQVFGPVASDTTALRALGEIGDVDLYRIDERRAAARAHPAEPVARRGTGLVLRRWGEHGRHGRAAGGWHDHPDPLR